MLHIAKAAALLAVAAAAFVVALRFRDPPPPTTLVVERAAPAIPTRTVRVTTDEISYQGKHVAHVPFCPDCPCFKIEPLLDALGVADPPGPPFAFDAKDMVIVEVDGPVDNETERQVLVTVSVAGFWPVVTYR